MCFSATASLVAGGALSATGVLTISQVKTKADLPFASIPLLFGIQQLIEGVVWLSFGHPALNTAATYTYSMFSHVLWPIYVPFSILLLETSPVRKKILRGFSIAGLGVGIYFFYFIIHEGVRAQIVNNSIAYISPHLYLLVVMTFYVAATCISGLFSSHKIIKIFAIIMSASFLIAGWFYNTTFISVWCFLAAILSVIVYWYFKNKFVIEGQIEAI